MRLSNSESEVMETLWASEEPLSLSELIRRSPQRSWKDRSAFSILNSLLKKGLICEAGFTHSGKTIARTFAPTMSYPEFAARQLAGQDYQPPIPSLVSALLDHAEITEETLAELEALIEKKREGLHHG